MYMPPISVLIKPASGLCNMSCDYCFYCDETHKRSIQTYGMMTEETLKNVIRKTILRAEGSISYAFQGGEPTLRGLAFFEKVIFYQNKYNKNQIPVSNALQTNGYAINEEWCRFFKENHFLIGISADGTKKIHDRYRHGKEGGGTFDKIHAATKIMDQYQVDYNILTVVTREASSCVDEIYNHCKANGWHYQQYIACLDPLGEERGKNKYALHPEEYGAFLTRLFELWYADLQKGQQPYIRQFENYIGILCGYAPEACDQRGFCGIQYVVEADGSVYPCDFYMLDEYRLGNFNSHQLSDMEEKRKEIRFEEKSRQISRESMACKYYSICRCGCQRNREYNEKTGCFENYFCGGYQIFFDNCYEKMMEIASHIKEKG